MERFTVEKEGFWGIFHPGTNPEEKRAVIVVSIKCVKSLRLCSANFY